MWRGLCWSWVLIHYWMNSGHTVACFFSRERGCYSLYSYHTLALSASEGQPRIAEWSPFFFFFFFPSLKQSSLWDFVVDCSSVCPNPNCNGNMVHDFWFWTCVKVSSCDNASWGICLSEQSCCTCFSFSLPPRQTVPVPPLCILYKTFKR